MWPASDPSPDDSRRHMRRLALLTVLMLLAWILLIAPLPWSLLAGVVAAAALVVLVPVAVSAFRRGRRGSAVLAAVVGVPATLMIITSSLVSVLFYGPMSELEECRDTALTQRAEAQCRQDVEDSVATWLGDLTGS